MRAIDQIEQLLEHWGLKNVLELNIHCNWDMGYPQVFLDVTMRVEPPMIDEFGVLMVEYKRFKLVEIEDGETTSSSADSSTVNDAASEEGSTL